MEIFLKSVVALNDKTKVFILRFFEQENVKYEKMLACVIPKRDENRILAV